MQKDAGSDIANALPITYSQYNGTLSTEDNVDLYKFYARAGEGIGMIATPDNPSLQLAVDLLGENGEILSQTQAPQAGAPLSFQTSPLGKNTTIYIQIKDNNLSGLAVTGLKKYTLELKPIVVAVPVTPEPSPTATTETLPPAGVAELPTQTPPPPPSQPIVKSVTKESSFSTLGYSALGIVLLAGLVTLLIVLRKMRMKKMNGGKTS